MANPRFIEVAEAAKPNGTLPDRRPAITGFVLRIQPSGAKLWKLRYTRPDGTRTVRTVGKMPVMTAEMARARVTAILQGDDPDTHPRPTTPSPTRRYVR